MRLIPASTTAIILCLALSSMAYAQKDSTGSGGTLGAPLSYGQVIMNSTWDRIEKKPETATRWPSWSEVTNKPSTFMPATHNHDSRYIPKNGFGEISGHLRIKDFSDEVPMSSLYTNAIDIVHEGDGSNGDDIEISTFNDTSRNGAMLSGRRHRGTFANPESPVNNDKIISLSGRAFSKEDNAIKDVANVHLKVDELPDGGKIQFATANPETSKLKNRMSIRNSGRIGVGTDNPGGILHIVTKDDHGNPEDVLITGKGKVGIGVTSTKGKIHVDSRATNPGLPAIYSNTHWDDAPDLLMDNQGIIATESDMAFTTKSDSAYFSFRNGALARLPSTEIARIRPDGTIRATGFQQNSDERLKENIVPLEGSLEKINRLDGVSYRWKQDDSGETQIGLIAQQVQEVYPELVDMNEETGFLTVDYPALVGPLISAINELSEANAVLSQRISVLEDQLQEQE